MSNSEQRILNHAASTALDKPRAALEHCEISAMQARYQARMESYVSGLSLRRAEGGCFRVRCIRAMVVMASDY